MKKQRPFNLMLIVFLLISSLLAAPIRLLAQDPAPTAIPGSIPQGTLPGVTSELTVLDVQPRIALLAEKTGRSVDELSSMTDAQIVDLFDQNREVLGVLDIARVVTSTIASDSVTETVAISVGAESSASQIMLPLISRSQSDAQTSPTPTPQPTPTATPTPAWTPPVLPVTVDELKNRVVAANTERFVSGQCPSEGPGAQTWIVDHSESNRIIAIGHNDGTNDFTSFENVIVGTTYDMQGVIFYLTDGQLKLDVDVMSQNDGKTQYAVTVKSYTSQHSITLRFGNYIVLNEVKGVALPYKAAVTLDPGKFIPMARYTVRHGCEFGTWRSAQLGKFNDTIEDGKLLLSAGFTNTVSVWGPVYGQALGSPYEIFTLDAFRECAAGIDGTNTPTQFWGEKNNYVRYAYESKVCLSPGGYILAYEIDPLGKAHFGQELIVIYGDPDVKVEIPGPVSGNTSPRELARDIENNHWVEDVGIPKLTSPYGSGIRLFAFAVLEFELCYDFHDATSCSFVPKIVKIMSQIQVGLPPFDQYQLETEEFGRITRGYCQGCVFTMWERKEVVSASGLQQLILTLAKKSIIEEGMDLLGMSPEFMGLNPTTMETTYAFVQAMLVLIDRLDPSYTADMPWIPRPKNIVLSSQKDYFGAPYVTSDSFSEVIRQTSTSYVCQQLKGVRTCLYKLGQGSNLILNPGYGYEVDGASASFKPSGNAIDEDAGAAYPCPLGPAGASLCAFPAWAYPHPPSASEIVSEAVENGCRDVTVSDGVNTFPGGVDIRILKNRGYFVTSSVDCNVTID